MKQTNIHRESTSDEAEPQGDSVWPPRSLIQQQVREALALCGDKPDPERLLMEAMSLQATLDQRQRLRRMKQVRGAAPKVFKPMVLPLELILRLGNRGR